VIKALLLAGLVVVGILVVRRRDLANYEAGKKLLLAAFVALFIVTVLFPNVTTTVAQWVGVGRGADLLLYALVLAFVFVSLNVWLRFGDQRYRTAELARQVALVQAEQAYGNLRLSTLEPAAPDDGGTEAT
jgi:hypothetical protein